MSALELVLSGYLAFGQLIPGGQQEIVKYAGLQVVHADGAVTLRLVETGRDDLVEKDVDHTVIRLRDETRPFEVRRHVRRWHDCDAVETWVEIEHRETGPVRLLRADSLAVRVPDAPETVKALSLTGQWGWEAYVVDTAVKNGQVLELSAKAGTRDAWESNAGMMIALGDDVTERTGRVIGVALEWTGTNSRRIRRDCAGKTDVFAGVDMTTGPYVLDPGTVFTTPKAIVVGSEKGRGEISRQFHRWARRHLMPHGRQLHPVLLNSWEGSYFSFTEKTLTDMMDGVRELGGEMFVLDDGWFGHGKYARDDKNKDTVGLGDWHVNAEKLPHGLGWLAAEANRRGLQFGLWVEPEMVNVKSWLAEEHPEWLLREEGRPLALGRGGTQTVLDYTNPALRERIYKDLDAVYSDIPTLAYVKWDSNQNIVNPGSTYLAADRQANLWYDYTMGLYDLLAKFQARRPGVMVQACASGGGHMDFGFLRYADEFWASDNTDPYQRIFIQWGASQFYPANAMACHVTASPCHQTGRETPLKYRFDVAMSGRLGIELHPKDLSADDLAFAKTAIADYKRIRPVVQQGDLYRLASPYENSYSALMYATEKKDRAVVFVLGLDRPGDRTARLSLDGLSPDVAYEIRELNVRGATHGFRRDGLEFDVELKGAYDSAVFELVATAAADAPRVFEKRPAAEWPLITIRQAYGPLRQPERTKEVLALHRRYPDACDEMWLAHGAGACLEDVRTAFEKLASYRPILEDLGIAVGFQQGVTLGHQDITAEAGGGIEGRIADFPDDIWQRDEKGKIRRMFCPRAPALHAYETEYLKIMGETLSPESIWFDDDLRLGLSVPGCFCDRCLKAFAEEWGSPVSREEIARRMSGGDDKDPLRRAWRRFRGTSLAEYAKVVRRAVDTWKKPPRLALQAVGSCEMACGMDWFPVLREFSGADGRPVGIRAGHGSYREDFDELLPKLLWLARESERCRDVGYVASVSYEQENYRREILHKSVGTALMESALALFSGCDALTEYRWDGARDEPLRDSEEFLEGLQAWRPFYERISRGVLATRATGLSRIVGSDVDMLIWDTVDTTRDLDLQRCGIPIAPDSAPMAKVHYADGATLAALSTNDVRNLAKGRLIVDSDIVERLKARFGEPAREALESGRWKAYPFLRFKAKWNQVPTTAELFELYDLIDEMGGAQVRLDYPRLFRLWPRVDRDGRLKTLAVWNMSVGAVTPTEARVAASGMAKGYYPDGTTVSLPIENGRLTIPALPAMGLLWIEF